MNAKEIGEKIRKLRIKRGLSLRALEELTGISNANLSRIERGKAGVPQINTINIILENLNAKLEIIEKT